MNENDNHHQQILIVDDIPKNLMLLGSFLKRDDLKIALAQSGQQALDYVESKQPDLILLDIMMPGMDGYEVCKRLKENDATKNIPVIFITALNNSDDEYLGLSLGAVDYIAKPFNPKIVKARIDNYLRLKRKTDLLENLSSIDGLTEIANRRKFEEIIDIEWKRAKRSQTMLSILMIDIDYFKQFNDTYGHASGDNCLRRVAKTLKNTLNRPADFVARYGGEEFIAILPETKNNSAVEIANQMRTGIENLNIPHEKSKVSEFVTISMGVATAIPQNNSSQERLIEAADKCLYTAKERGRNQAQSIELTE